MISVERGFVSFEGRKLDIMSELTGLMHELMDSDTITKEDLELCVETSFMSDEELSKAIAEKLVKSLLGH